jgi:protocatechuate 3,4-dioxygenase beta subunit
MTHPHAPHPDTDDEPVGRVFSRREFLGVLAAAGGTLTLAACGPSAPAPSMSSAPSTQAVPSTQAPLSPASDGAALAVDCLVSPAQAEGPFFVDEMLNRSDIRSDPSTGVVKQGTLMTLALAVAEVADGSCRPIPGALVDLWHCDADGVYSAFNDGRTDARGDYSLRGQQLTDEGGRASFITIFPGWYPGRAVHLHFKVRYTTEDGSPLEFTSQLYFDDGFTDEVLAGEPYAGRGPRSTRNVNDALFRNGGEQLVVPASLEEGVARASFTVGMVT